MAVTVTHPFVSAIADGTDASLVRPSNWNATHSISGTLDITNGGTGVTTGTGTGSVVLNTSPTLITPVLGTPTSGNFGTGTFTWPTFNQNTTGTAAGLSATLAVASGGTGVTTSTGTGSVVLSTSPTLVTPLLGTPTSGNFSTGTFTWPTFNQNTSGTAAGLSATLVIANGGTNSTATPTAGGVSYGTGTAYGFTAAGTTGQVLTSTGSGVPSWATVGGLGTVTSVAATVPAFLSISGSPITTTGTLAIGLSGTALPVANGGTNATTASITSFNNITGYTASGATGTTSTNLVFSTTPTLTNPTVTNYVETLYSANTGTALTIDLANGTVQKLTLTGNATLTMPTAVAGKSFIIILAQDATGGRSVTWTTVAWPSATAPTITSTLSKKDLYSFFSDGTSWYGATIAQNYT